MTEPRAPLDHIPTTSTASFASTAALVALVTTLVGCDSATKYAADTSLRHGAGSVVAHARATLVPGVFDLVYTENHDTAFRVLRALSWPGKPELLAVTAWLGAAAIICTWWTLRRTAGKSLHLAFALTLAGALGNAVDRVTRGFVVDFLHLHAGRFDWPVFNVADVSVVAGAAMFAFCICTKTQRPPLFSGWSSRRTSPPNRR